MLISRRGTSRLVFWIAIALLGSDIACSFGCAGAGSESTISAAKSTAADKSVTQQGSHQHIRVRTLTVGAQPESPVSYEVVRPDDGGAK